MGGCMSPAPKFELRIAQERMVYKIWDLVFKIVQNYVPVFYVQTSFWRAACHQSQIWIEDSARRKGVQNLRRGVQNCTKWIQIYDLDFYVNTAFQGGCCMSSTPKFKLLIADEERVYEIGSLLFRIVQNECEIMVQFFMLKLHLRLLHVTSPQIWIAESAKRKVVQNLGLGVQNCTKWIQYYDLFLYVETALWGYACHQPPNLNCG